MRTELGFWSVLVGTVGVTGTAKVKALQTLDALQKLDCVGDSQPVGYYGLSQGGGVGMHLVAAEPRITAAVLGLDEATCLSALRRGSRFRSSS